MTLAELMVRITADTADVTTKMRNVERSLVGVEKSATSAGGGMRKIENAIASYVQRVAGANAVTRELSVGLSGMALGGSVATGILLGVGAIVAVYQRLTQAARDAAAANAKLLQSLSDSNFRQSLGPEPDLVLQTNAQRNTLRQQQSRRRSLIAFGVSPDDQRILDLNREIANSQRELEVGEKRLFDARMAASKPLETVMVKGVAGAKEMTFGFNQLRDAAARVNEELTKDKTDWWRNYIEATGKAKNITEEFIEEARRAQPEMFDIIKGMIMPDIPVMMPKVSVNDSVSKAQIEAAKKMGILIDRGDQNTVSLQQTILQSAQIISSAVNIGGGGRGSSIGSALGGVLGAGLTVGAGVLTSGLWGIAGSLLGSVVGGIFDSHKKEVNANTQAVRENTAALLRNQPSGFKIEPYRYDASTASNDIGRAMRRRASRGGPNPLLAGT